MRRRILFFLIVAFLAYFILTQPVEAATMVRSSVNTARSLLGGFADSLSTFLNNLITQMAPTSDGGDSEERRDDTSPIQPVQRSSAFQREGDGEGTHERAVVVDTAPPVASSPAVYWGSKYLARNEHIQLIIRPHVAMIAGSALLTLAVAMVAFVASPVNGRWDLSDLVWYLFWWLFLRFSWDAFFWWRDRIVITDERIFRVSGIFTRVAGSMPLRMLTDLTYRRTISGYALGYGTFIVESAGQDQALSTIDFVPEPDRVYQIINTLVFSGR